LPSSSCASLSLVLLVSSLLTRYPFFTNRRDQGPFTTRPLSSQDSFSSFLASHSLSFFSQAHKITARRLSASSASLSFVYKCLVPFPFFALSGVLRCWIFLFIRLLLMSSFDRTLGKRVPFPCTPEISPLFSRSLSFHEFSSGPSLSSFPSPFWAAERKNPGVEAVACTDSGFWSL